MIQAAMTQVMTRRGPRRAKLCLPTEVTRGTWQGGRGLILGIVVQAAPGFGEGGVGAGRGVRRHRGGGTV